MKHKALFDKELNEAAAQNLAAHALMAGKRIEDIDEITFDWHYSRDGMDTTTRSTVYPDAAIQARARVVLDDITA